jgi:hypothetical protein
MAFQAQPFAHWQVLKFNADVVGLVGDYGGTEGKYLSHT